jgi:hypothetical protein
MYLYFYRIVSDWSRIVCVRGNLLSPIYLPNPRPKTVPTPSLYPSIYNQSKTHKKPPPISFHPHPQTNS